ncbi:MAG: MmgE/PrpD family protein [Pseudomonadota bacterium]
MRLTETLSRFVSTATPSLQSNRLLLETIADCFGCMLAGADSDVVARVSQGIEHLSRGDVVVYGRDITCSPGHAAMLNAISGHAYELDDWEEKGNTHPTVVILPALLAGAHLNSVPGEKLYEAYLKGFEVITRLGEAMTLDHYARGFHATATLGALGATAAVCVLLDLKERQVANALALAASQACGYTAQFGTDAKALHAGFAARTGVECAVLASKGVTANLASIDSDRGMVGLLGNLSSDRVEDVICKVGNPYAFDEQGIVIKPWPSCGYAHRLMTAALDLRQRIGANTDNIVSIRATQPDFHSAILAFDEPRNRTEALFSGPACIAQTLVTGDMSVADGAREFWKEPDVARLIPLTEMVAEPTKNPSINYDPQQPDTLQIVMKDGQEFLEACVYPLGSPHNRLNQAQLADKFSLATGRGVEEFSGLMRWPKASDIASFFEKAARR